MIGKSKLAGRRVLITAGPTQEAIDPVRYIGNRSSGKMGIALAEEAGPDPTLASVWSAIEPSAAAVPLATLGARRELGGPAALVVARPFPWRTISLWAVLIAGVLVVGTMAARLAREMRSPTS